MKILCRSPFRYCFLLLLAASSHAMALDTSAGILSLRVGNPVGETFDPKDVHRSIFARGLSGPADVPGVDDEGQLRESYLVYQHNVDAGKLRLGSFKLGALRGIGATFGAGWNSRHDAGYSARQRLLVAGPTLTWNVPGFLSTSLLLRHQVGDVDADTFTMGRQHRVVSPMLSATWAIPLTRRWAFEGYANVVAPGLGGDPADSGGASLEMQLMFDASAAMGYRKNTFRIGLDYQYADRKFGNTWLDTGGAGFRIRSPGVRAEYRF